MNMKLEKIRFRKENRAIMKKKKKKREKEKANICEENFHPILSEEQSNCLRRSMM